MKPKVYVTLLTTGLVLLATLATIINRGNHREMTGPEVADQLLRLINKQQPGSNFQVKPGNNIVEPIENNRYRVTFKNFTINTDLPIMVNYIYKIMAKGVAVPKVNTVRVGEASITYDADKELFETHWLKNIEIDHEMAELPGDDRKLKLEGTRVKKYHCKIGKVSFNDPYIESNHESGSQKILGKTGNRFPGAINPFQSFIENLKFGLTFITRQADLFSVFLEIEKMGDAKSAYEDPDAFMYIFDKDVPIPDLENTLKNGWAIIDTNLKIDRVNISIEKNGMPWGVGGFDNISYSLFLKPDETGNKKSDGTYERFKLGCAFELKDLKLSIPGKKGIERLADIEEFRIEVAMKKLIPNAALAFLTLIRKLYLLRDQDQSGMQEIMLQGLLVQAAIGKSKPSLHLSIPTLKHYFGQMNVGIDIQLQGLLAVPEMKLNVDLFKMDDTLNRLKNCKLFSPAALKSFSRVLDKYMLPKENGDASLTIEFDPKQPDIYLLNGAPQKRSSSNVPRLKMF